MKHITRRIPAYQRATTLVLLVCLQLLGTGLIPSLTPSAASPPANTPRPSWGTDGSVNAIVSDGVTAYIGGYFSAVGPISGSGVALDASTGQYDPALPYVTGTVLSVVPDQNGGWYIGGCVTAVAGQPRQSLAHIRADKILDPLFDPRLGADACVSSLVLHKGILYVGGRFSTVNGGLIRNNLAAFNATTGSATSFNPDVGGMVHSIALDGTSLYVGGSFTIVNGGTARTSLAAFDTTTGSATSFNPGLSGGFYSNTAVVALVLDGTTLYAGGSFSMVNDTVSRRNLAAFDTTTGTATAFHPAIEGDVHCLALGGNRLYVGGMFFVVNDGMAHNNLVAFDLATGALSGFDPQLAMFGLIEELVLNGTILYAAGSRLATADGAVDRNLAAFDAASGAVFAFDAHLAPGAVRALALDGTTLYAGGTFRIANGVARSNLAAIDVFSGQATAFNPNIGDTSSAFVSALVLDGRTLYVGGFFSMVNGELYRNNLAAFDTTTGRATYFWPSIRGHVSALAIRGSTLYVGGHFDTFSPSLDNRYNLVALDTTTSIGLPYPLSGFDPQVAQDGSVDMLVLNGTTLYAGGSFTTVNGGIVRNNLAAFDTLTGAATSFNPDVVGSRISSVRALALDGTTLYAGGSFTTVNGGVRRNNLAAFDTLTGMATAFDPNLDGSVNTLLVSDNTLYAGGTFTHANGITERQSVAAFDRTIGLVTTFDPRPDTDVYALTLSSADLLMGGSFTTVAGQPQIGLALLPLEGIPIVATRPATGVVRDAARLNGIVNARGSTLDLGFQLTTASGDYTNAMLIAATPAHISGTSDRAVTGRATGLMPGVAYYYRVVAIDTSGETLGAEQTFTTNSPPALPLIVRQE